MLLFWHDGVLPDFVGTMVYSLILLAWCIFMAFLFDSVLNYVEGMFEQVGCHRLCSGNSFVTQECQPTLLLTLILSKLVLDYVLCQLSLFFFGSHLSLIR